MNNNMTIFEGPDGAGKSTVMNTLMEYSSRRRVSIHHGPYLTEEKIMRYYMAPLLTQEKMLHFFYDRSWISEQVYGKVYRGVDRLGVAGRRMLERVALTNRAVMVLCVPPYDICESAYLARKGAEYLETSAALRDVWGYYAAEKFVTHLPIVRFDYTAMNPHTLHELVREARPRPNQGPGIGHWREGVTLLVGDRQNYDRRFKYHPGLTFVAQDESRVGCSCWLAEQLEAWGIPESDLYWVNAYTSGGYSTDPSFIEHLRPRRIVALGNMAEAWLRYHARVDSFITVDHPQYHKRFRFDKPYKLETVLKN